MGVHETKEKRALCSTKENIKKKKKDERIEGHVHTDRQTYREKTSTEIYAPHAMRRCRRSHEQKKDRRIRELPSLQWDCHVERER